ncbi:MAG: hypothetical protein KIT83_19900 [Bryobacterales bacterium]|nr:hypothetical protein [Bryobacterales bacterium]
MTAAFPLILGVADILVRGFLLAMVCGIVFLWILHKAAVNSRQMRSLSPAPPMPRPVPLRPEPYRLRSARPGA